MASILNDRRATHRPRDTKHQTKGILLLGLVADREQPSATTLSPFNYQPPRMDWDNCCAVT